RRLRIEDAAGRKYAEHPSHTHLTRVAIHPDFDEMGAEAGMRISAVEVGGRDRSLGLLHPRGQPGFEFPAVGENRGSGGRRPKRATRAGGGWEEGIANMNGDTIDR